MPIFFFFEYSGSYKWNLTEKMRKVNLDVTPYLPVSLLLSFVPVPPVVRLLLAERAHRQRGINLCTEHANSGWDASSFSFNVVENPKFWWSVDKALATETIYSTRLAPFCHFSAWLISRTGNELLLLHQPLQEMAFPNSSTAPRSLTAQINLI